MRVHMYPAGTLERLVLSDRGLVAYVPLPATSSGSVPVDTCARMTKNIIYGCCRQPAQMIGILSRPQPLKVVSGNYTAPTCTRVFAGTLEVINAPPPIVELSPTTVSPPRILALEYTVTLFPIVG